MIPCFILITIFCILFFFKERELRRAEFNFQVLNEQTDALEHLASLYQKTLIQVVSDAMPSEKQKAMDTLRASIELVHAKWSKKENRNEAP